MLTIDPSVEVVSTSAINDGPTSTWVKFQHKFRETRQWQLTSNLKRLGGESFLSTIIAGDRARLVLLRADEATAIKVRLAAIAFFVPFAL
jgi:hypothetical protein